MTKTVSLRDANQRFARLVREVEAGQGVIITRRGEPIAKLSSIAGKRRVPTLEQEAAWRRLLKRIGERRYRSEGWQFDRDELHER
jgi:prevent-host-death family protein